MTHHPNYRISPAATRQRHHDERYVRAGMFLLGAIMVLMAVALAIIVGGL